MTEPLGYDVFLNLMAGNTMVEQLVPARKRFVAAKRACEPWPCVGADVTGEGGLPGELLAACTMECSMMTR